MELTPDAVSKTGALCSGIDLLLQCSHVQFFNIAVCMKTGAKSGCGHPHVTIQCRIVSISYPFCYSILSICHAVWTDDEVGPQSHTRMRLVRITSAIIHAAFAGVEASPGFGQPAAPGGARSGCPAVLSEGRLL